MKLVRVLTKDGIKSIPLHAFPAEAFTSLLGESAGAGNDILKYYENVPWLYRGTNARADALANIPFTWDVRGQENDDYVLPFRLQLDQLLNEIEGDLTLHGAAYVYKDMGTPLAKRKIRRLLPTSIKPVTDPDEGLIGFKRRVGSHERVFNTEEIAYIWAPNRRKEIGPGTPPARAALEAAGVLTNAGTFLAKYFDQGTIMPMVLAIDENANETDVNRLESWLQRRLTGIKNAFGLVAVRGGVTPQTLGQSDLEKLAMESLTNQKREDIATALGVPHSLLFSNAANYATAEQDAMNWYELTIIPEARRIEDALNDQLFEPMAGVRLIFKPEQLEVFQQRELDKALKLVTLKEAHVITVNEVREPAGYPPLPDGDTLTNTVEPVSEPASDDADVSAAKGEIFGYHIDLGVVTRNEARASLGLPPVEETETERRNRELQSLLSTLQAAVTAGIPLENAIPMVGMEDILPPDQIKKSAPPNSEAVDDSDDDDADKSFMTDLRAWKRKATSRLKAGKSLGFAFRSDAIEASLVAAIEGALEACRSADDVRRVFDDAMRWSADHE